METLNLSQEDTEALVAAMEQTHNKVPTVKFSLAAERYREVVNKPQPDQQ
ncbi:hypothetical protein NVP1187O_116 [Vibrio phage 1.187.O._10N.286.49.F1]|nr:hypothetical protein NVP1187O_116 [Vibrio phage 1.187.O._10N.286.49.F1]